MAAAWSASSSSSTMTMTPYFETAKSFADVPITVDGVDTEQFLEASDDFVNLFDLFGSMIFGFIQTDLRNNIQGVRSRFEDAPEVSATLEELVRNDTSENQRYGTACLVRLMRGLAFTCQALQNMQNDTSAELRICFKRSYDAILRQYHTFLIRSAVAVAIRAVPRRNEFYARLAQGGSVEKLDAELTKWLAALEEIVRRMSMFLEEGEYGKV